MAAEGPYAEPAPQEWLAPAQMPYAPPPPDLPTTLPMFELRPLSLGEVLDRTFSLYRSRFWLFCGISCFSGIVQALSAAVQLAIQGRIVRNVGASTGLQPTAVLFSVCGQLLFALAYSITSAATVFAMGEVYLGRATSIKASFAATIRRWYAYIGIAFWQAGSMVWLPLLLIAPGFALLTVSSLRWLGVVLLVAGIFGGTIGGYILYLRNSFGVPAYVMERLKVRAAMRRSKVLTSGTKWRVFVVHLIAACLYMVAGVVQAPLAFIALMIVAKGGHAFVLQIITLLIGFVAHTVVVPVAMIGLTLLYFDQRVRKEAFDIHMLLGNIEAAPHISPAVPLDATEG